jgi:hypothetical protein
MSVLDWGPFSRVRRNHALEHATLQVMAEKNPKLRMAGYSDPGGFWLVGEADINEIEQSAQQALNRLRGGESSLAIHPHCGTNLVTTSLLAGAAAWLGMLGTGRTNRDRIERLPMVISLVALTMMASQPLGPYVQEHVTTSASPQGMENMQILKIERVQRGEVPLHRVLTHS